MPERPWQPESVAGSGSPRTPRSPQQQQEDHIQAIHRLDHPDQFLTAARKTGCRRGTTPALSARGEPDLSHNASAAGTVCGLAQKKAA
jgi:hypothetical protein